MAQAAKTPSKTRKTAGKASGKVASKATSKSASKAAPKATAKTAAKSKMPAQKAASKTTTKATTRATSKAVSKAAPKAIAKATAKPKMPAKKAASKTTTRANGRTNGKAATKQKAAAAEQAATFDVIIVGAGISGISAAWHLQKKCPNKTYALLENRAGMGGTWDLFRYPGIRSDSDMHTMGFDFKPWTAPKSISDGSDIRQYIEEAASENGIDEHIHFQHKLLRADWDSTTSLWTLEVATPQGDKAFKCNFLQMCCGYYSYDKGYLPEFPGYDNFKGTLVHPQHWPKNLDYSGQKVVIIGSGATAVTLLPSMVAGDNAASQVTMLQRSPTYMVSAPAIDPIGAFLRKVMPESWAYKLTRLKNILGQRFFFWYAKKSPEKVKAKLIDLVRTSLGDNYDVDTHFTPSYNPWDQRLCLVPDEDFFAAIRDGKAVVVTDQIKTFTEKGIELQSGEHLDADLIVTATGLNMEILANIDLVVDGKPVSVPDSLVYKGAMLSDVPNMAYTMGYSNASWTLKADLTSKWVCRLLNYMQRKGYSKCMPALNGAQAADEPMMNLSSGYVQRALERLPKQGEAPPWQQLHNYLLDRLRLGITAVADGVLEFSGQAAGGHAKAASAGRQLEKAA